jgi:hypothetical protein
MPIQTSKQSHPNLWICKPEYLEIWSGVVCGSLFSYMDVETGNYGHLYHPHCHRVIYKKFRCCQKCGELIHPLWFDSKSIRCVFRHLNMKRRRLLWVWQRMCQCGFTVDKAMLRVEYHNLKLTLHFVGDIELWLICFVVEYSLLLQWREEAMTLMVYAFGILYWIHSGFGLLGWMPVIFNIWCILDLVFWFMLSCTLYHVF